LLVHRLFPPLPHVHLSSESLTASIQRSHACI
jgi:hypothetical protein